MDLHISGKTALITGSSSGIGNAIARRLAAEGCHIIIHGRSEASVQPALEVLIQDYPHTEIRGIAADLSDEAQVDSLIKSLPALDILINNAGIFTAKAFVNTSDEDWHRMLEVNLMSGVRLSRACLAGMMERNWGRILFVSSECAQLVPPDMIAYSTSKAALHALARGLAQTAKGSGVTVNTLMPGSTLSEGAERFLQEAAVESGLSTKEVADRFFQEVRTSSLLQRFASTDEVAAAAVFCCSSMASITSGAVIRADGGSVSGIF